MFYEALKGIHKTFSGTTSVKIKISINFLSSSGSGTGRVNIGLTRQSLRQYPKPGGGQPIRRLKNIDTIHQRSSTVELSCRGKVI